MNPNYVYGVSFLAVLFVSACVQIGQGTVLKRGVSASAQVNLGADQKESWCSDWRTCAVSKDAPELERLVNYAMLTHPQVASAAADVRTAQAALSTMKWQRAPSPYAEAATDGSDTNANVGLEVPVWNGGAQRSRVKESDARLAKAKVQLLSVQMGVAANVIESYAKWSAAQRSVEYWKAALKEHRAMQETLDRRSEAGLSGTTDTMLASSKTASVEGDLLMAQTTVSSAFSNLSNAVGLALVETELNSEANYHLPHSRLTAVEIASAVEQHPSLKLAILEVEARNAAVETARRSLFPALSLRLNEGLKGSDNDGVQLQFRTNIGGGLSSRERVKEAEAQQQSAGNLAEAARRSAQQEIQSSQLMLAASTAQVENAKSIQKTSEEIYSSIKRQWEVGQSKSWQDVLSASRDAAASGARVADAEGSQLSASWQYYLLVRGVTSDGVL
jgi:adhesin transport system outer membrane protein